MAGATDGRRQRSQASREKLIEAMLELIREGRIVPGAEAVAARAGLGLRTVFRHFADMESLNAELAARLAHEYAYWLEPFTATDWRGQLTEMMARRLETYERLMPFKRSADVHRHRSPTMQRNHAALLTTMRDRLMAILPPVLASDPARRESIDLLLSFETWQRLRLDQHLSPDAARAVVAGTIEMLIA